MLRCLEANLALLTGRPVEEVRAVGVETLRTATESLDAPPDVACVAVMSCSWSPSFCASSAASRRRAETSRA